QTLRARGMPLALVTNGDATEQRWKIERCALAPFFGAIVIEGELGAGKPDAVVYHTALKALGVAPGPDVWMVGDHLEFDAVGAPPAAPAAILAGRSFFGTTLAGTLVAARRSAGPASLTATAPGGTGASAPLGHRGLPAAAATAAAAGTLTEAASTARTLAV